jgi:L-alanine-DL-glutamate epimerase-like enolase superfamily enzyme
MSHNVRYPQEYDFNVSRQDFGNLLVKGASVAKDGFVQPSDRPGLGVELDRATVSRLAAL